MTRLLPRFLGWQQEVPSGVIDGSNLVFTLSSTPYDTATLELTLDGIKQISGTHFTLSGSTITFVNAPVVSQDMFAMYRKA